MKKELLKEVKELLESGELLKEEVLLELFTDEDGNLYLSHLDFSDFEGDVYIDNMKVNWNLRQKQQEVGGHLFQSKQKVKGDLYQSYHEVKGDYYATDIKVKGEIDFEKPTKMLKKITLKELKEMGYELEEGK